MTSDDELRQLRRAAFGRSSTPDEQREAVRRLAEIEAESARAEPAVAEHTIPAVDVPEPLAAPPPDAPDGEVPNPSRSVRAIWLVPVILVSLVVGAFGGSLWRPAPPTVTPRAHSSFALGTDSSGQPGGDLVAADTILAKPRAARDAFPLPTLVQNLDQNSTRYLGGAAGALQLWAGLNSEAELCLLLYEASNQSGAASCVTPENFTAHGITLGFNQYQVSWDGTGFDSFLPFGN